MRVAHIGALSGYMEKMIDQLTNRLVERIQKLAEEERNKEEIRRGKKVKVTVTEDGMSDIQFEPGASFTQEENKKVDRILTEIEVEEQQLRQSKHALVIPPGGVRAEFPLLEVGQVTILIKKLVVPVVPQKKKKKKVKKPEVEIPI
jgi:hypothetical protein